MELLKDFSQIPFYILSSIAVLAALTMIFNPNVVRAGFALIASFSAIAGIFFLLAANFVAVSQILIYAVGIVLVIIFAIMLCSLKEAASDVVNDEKSNLYSVNLRKFMALLLSSGLFFTLVFVINSQDWNAVAKLNGADGHKDFMSEIARQYTAEIGHLMLSRYLIAFELVSILLLVVLVGVIILSKKDIECAEACSK